MLALQDLEFKTESEIKDHIANCYCDYDSNEDIVNSSRDKVAIRLNQLDILIAYESVGDWGCDSSSFFLFQDKENGQLFELHGSHCSCYGFEGQFKLEESSIEALLFRMQNNRGSSVFYTGGYDYSETENNEKVNKFILDLNEKFKRIPND